MKLTVLLTLIASIMSVSLTFAQVPQSINYQAVIRTDSGVVIANKAVNIRLSVQDGLTTPPQYVEQHSVTTNQFGLVTLSIGKGAASTGVFNQINWSIGEKFLKTEVDVNRNGSFTVIGTQQFLSVPYALYAEKAGNVVTPSNDNWKITGNVASTGQFIGTTNAQDLRLYTEGSQKMVVKTNGNVGIGTNTPDFKMVVETLDGVTAGIDDGRTLMQLHNKSSTNYATTNLRIKTGNTPNVTMLSHYGPTYTLYPGFADYGLMLSTGSGIMMQAPGGNIRFMTGPAPNNVGIYDRMVITNEGNVGFNTATPKAKIEVANGDVYVSDATKGIILKSPNGSCWRVTIDNLGNFVRTAITCP